ncbi:MAG TPA: hypothetical protein VIK84_06455 [Haloplasmataceae bacterium]
MLIKDKLKEIMKWEIISLTVIILIILIFIPCIFEFSKAIYSINKVISYIVIAIVLLILIVIVYKKIVIVKNVSWSMRNYDSETKKVYNFINERRASLISFQGHSRYYILYNDALILIKELMKNIK